MRKFLVVDDNVAFAENLAEIVGDACAGQTVVASSGEQALALLATSQFDAMVTDMRMPRMNGAQLIARARRLDPGLPIVIITAFTGHDDLSTAMIEGVLSVLPKPVPIPQLISHLAGAKRGGVVAVVDDDVSLTENVSEALRERGFATVTAHSVPDIGRFSGSPCLALVDLRLPGSEDGAALARVIERFPNLPIIVVTAFAHGVALPPDTVVIEKPFDTKRLLDTIERMAKALTRSDS